jgi:hypothetical protein
MKSRTVIFGLLLFGRIAIQPVLALIGEADA